MRRNRGYLDPYDVPSSHVFESRLVGTPILTLRNVASLITIDGVSSVEINIEEVAPPAQADLDALLAGLRAYNRAHMDEDVRETVACFAKDSHGAVVGGVYGKLAWGWLTVEIVWVDDAVRGHGVGRKLMGRLERYAAEKGVRRIRVETTSFQALDFYRKLGYDVFAVLPDCPPGSTNYCLKKLSVD